MLELKMANIKGGGSLKEAISNIMTRGVITCNPSDSILEVRDIISKNRISRLVISHDKKPLGIITFKDIVNFLIKDRTNRSLEEIQAKEVMSKNLITVNLDTPVKEVAKIMNSKNISSLLVLNEAEDIEGIITKSGLTLYYAIKGAGVHKVSDFMTKEPITVTSSHTIFIISNLMSKNKISKIIVVDHEKKPIGIVTLTDMTVLGNLLRPPEQVTENELRLAGGTLMLPRGIYLLTSRDLMTAHPISIKQDSDLSEAAKLMVRHRISGLPVVDGSSILVGIITKSDITRAIASNNN
ncbi:hypothetical protein AC481_05415 [miscellaneous Crenarchaeota group archaeon SMTZ-80]|nr:MAG: hypothetical protein AC481_05415 [miscellaneous Crenarchaeota group archaeon SMTZ-80]